MPVSRAGLRHRQIAKERSKEAKEAADHAIEARNATRQRYNRGDEFESDSVFLMQHKNAETDDMFARADDKTASKVMTGEELQRVEDIENPEAAAVREQALQDRLAQLESALPETVRDIDNLSEVHRPGERKSSEKFSGSLVDYVFKVQAEVEKAGAREMKERDQQKWINWLEKMYRRHQPFSDDHYKLFRRLCEGNLSRDPLWFKQLMLRRMVEKKRLTLDDCNKLGSEYTTIKTMYPAMRQQVEAHRAELGAKQGNASTAAGGDGADADNSDGMPQFARIGDALYREEGSDAPQWRWWSTASAGDAAAGAQKTLPDHFLQWCANVRFANEKTDVDTIKKSDIEVFCCAALPRGGGEGEGEGEEAVAVAVAVDKRIRFLTAGSASDDLARNAVTDETLRQWLNFGKDPVENLDDLCADAHIFLLDRVDDDKIDHWTLQCFNVCKEDADAAEKWKALWTEEKKEEEVEEEANEETVDNVEEKEEVAKEDENEEAENPVERDTLETVKEETKAGEKKKEE